jgi:exodeoxyribonuclease VII large subunit
VNHFTTVSDLTSSLKSVLSEHFSQISVSGEITNFKPSPQGHWYFSIRDSKSTISGVMFRGKTTRVPFHPMDGQRIKVWGSITIYEPQGKYQILVEAMEKAGVGDILKELEERKQRFLEEGLFDPARKQPLPLFPKLIGVVTSPTGAAIRDILQVLARRAKGSRIVVFPTLVQGSQAAEQIADQIYSANKFIKPDVIIVARGGGSLEDLLPFSEEILVRAIATSSIPIITGIGHETDNSLSDFVADLRAPTPSAAAELASGQQEELLKRVMNAGSSIISSFGSEKRRLELALKPFYQDRLEETFRTYLQPLLMRIDDSLMQLFTSMEAILSSSSSKLNQLRAIIETANPKEVLSRGYTMIQLPDSNTIITRSAQLPSSSPICIHFFDATRKGTIDHEDL